MKNSRLLFVLFSVLLLPGLFCPPAQAKPQVETSQSASQIYPDETLIFRIKVFWPASDGEYKLVVPQLLTHNLELKRQGESQENIKKDGKLWTAKSFEYELAPLGTGAGVINASSIQAVLPASQQMTLLDTPQIDVQIKQPVYDSLLGRMGMLLMGAGLLALLIMSPVLIRLRRQAKLKSESPVSAEDKKIECLKQIVDDKSQDAKSIVCNTLQELKQYLCQRYGLKNHQTADAQLLDSLRDKSVEFRDLKLIEEVLSTAYKVKFAGEEVSLHEAKSLGNKVIGFFEGKRIVGQESLS